MRPKPARALALARRLFSSGGSAGSVGTRPAPMRRALSQPTAFTHSNLMSAEEVTPGITRAEYMLRRKRLAEMLPERSLTIFPSNPQRYMSEDVPYLYHHNTDLMYLCGITEPGAVLMVEKGAAEADVLYSLFVSGRDASRELWDGPLCGADEEVRGYFGVDYVRVADDMGRYLGGALAQVESIHFDSLINEDVTAVLRDFDRVRLDMFMKKWDQNRMPKSFLLGLRVVKSEAEQQLLLQAAEIISATLNESMAGGKAGQGGGGWVDEKYIEGMIEFGCKKRGSARLAFPSVVASGPNGTILHYMNNNRRARAGDFVMVDAGCEVHGYSSDVSRSWPVSGRFGGAQREFYELILDVQKRCIRLASEDALFGNEKVSLDRMHVFAARELTDGLLQLGFMKGHSLQSALSTGAYARYFPHAIGHYLGMDVHDTHQLPKNIPLTSGMVVTVEPGLYCPADDVSAPAAFRGLGMRIEDDIVVGGKGRAVQVLSKDAVKEIDDVEAMVSCA